MPMPRVFSAHAEVVPMKPSVSELHKSILRARGGSSTVAKLVGLEELYSPRTRR